MATVQRNYEQPRPPMASVAVVGELGSEAGRTSIVQRNLVFRKHTSGLLEEAGFSITVHKYYEDRPVAIFEKLTREQILDLADALRELAE